MRDQSFTCRHSASTFCFILSPFSCMHYLLFLRVSDHPQLWFQTFHSTAFWAFGFLSLWLRVVEPSFQLSSVYITSYQDLSTACFELVNDLHLESQRTWNLWNSFPFTFTGPFINHSILLVHRIYYLATGWNWHFHFVAAGAAVMEPMVGDFTYINFAAITASYLKVAISTDRHQS